MGTPGKQAQSNGGLPVRQQGGRMAIYFWEMAKVPIISGACGNYILAVPGEGFPICEGLLPKGRGPEGHWDTASLQKQVQRPLSLTKKFSSQKKIFRNQQKHAFTKNSLYRPAGIGTFCLPTCHFCPCTKFDLPN